MKAIINGRFIIPDETGRFTVEGGLALFFDEKIRAIRSAATVSAAEREELEACIDARGAYVSPGFLNVHIHGCVGADAAVDVDVEEARRDIGPARIDARFELLALGRRDGGGGADSPYLLVEEEREPSLDRKAPRLVGDDESAVDDCLHGYSPNLAHYAQNRFHYTPSPNLREGIEKNGWFLL